jgi:ribosomal protein L11 methyltransferase
LNEKTIGTRWFFFYEELAVVMECSLKAIEHHILSLLERGAYRWTPTGLFGAVQAQVPAATRMQVRAAVKAMVLSGRLVFTGNGGSSFLEISRRGSLRVSDRIVLHQGYGPVLQAEGAVVVCLAQGASFGSGDHSTTRLALRGLDDMLLKMAQHKPLEKTAALDIGTGTGVLAIAAAKLGIGKVFAIDVDAVACHEAQMNASGNGVQQALEIAHVTLADVSTGRFDLILANLRPPTLVELSERMLELTLPGGYWILSGFREAERSALVRALPPQCRERWFAAEKSWCAVVCELSTGTSA